MLEAIELDIGRRYRVDGLGAGHWRPLWWDRSELVLVDVPAGGIKALISLADLTVISPGHLRYHPRRT